VASRDAIVIGAGHNGLVAAAYLAKAGRKVLVLEQRPKPGGIVATDEIYSGFKYNCAHLVPSFSAAVAADLNLKFELLPFVPLLFAPAAAGKSLIIPHDAGAAAAALEHHSRHDAENYTRFCQLGKSLASFLESLYRMPLPHNGDGNLHIGEMLRTGWKFRRLGRKRMYEFLRILPMSAADLLDEWFESELLKAAVAGGAMAGAFAGPRQQGTAYNLLHNQLGASNGALRIAGFVRGGTGNLAAALASAAQHWGAEIRTECRVARIVTKDGKATGVVLQNGEEIGGNTVVSNADVKRTFLELVEPTYLDPKFLLQVRNIRARGTLAKINLALDRLPQFRDADGARSLGGLIHIGPTIDYLERAADDAKYGRISAEPWLEITIPSVADSSLAPAGKHVMSVWMQSAPYALRESNWHEQRDPLGDLVINVIEQHASGFKNSVLHRQVLTPVDLEEVYGLSGGHIYHAEIALDQLFFMRPVPGWSRYYTPIENLFLCGSGTHPGGGITGLPGFYAARTILERRERKRTSVVAQKFAQ
jgi:phytoene dehydrogenase-like protein